MSGTELAAELLRRDQEIQQARELYADADRRAGDLTETVEACKAQLLHMQEQLEGLEQELGKERRVRKQLEQEAAEWGTLERQYTDKIAELRERFSLDSKTVSAEEESKRIELMKKSQDDNMTFRRKIEEVKSRYDASEKNVETMRKRLQEKDQAAELTYQKSLQFQELQSKQFTRQINKIIAEQERERADYENQLAVKDKELQALEVQCQVRNDFTKTTEQQHHLAMTSPAQEPDSKTRDEVDTLRQELEKVRCDRDSKLRALNHQVNKLQAENASVLEKCERLEQTAHARHAKVGQHQSKIAALNTELKALESERDAFAAKKEAELQRVRAEAKRGDEGLQHEATVLKETVEGLRQQLDQQERASRELARASEERSLAVLKRVEDDLRVKSREADDAARELAALKSKADDLSRAAAKQREEKAVYYDDLQRTVAKVGDLERELRATTEASTRLAERDAKLMHERDTLKVYIGKCRLELDKVSREKLKLAHRLGDTEKKLVMLTQNASSTQLLAICGKGGRRSDLSVKRAGHSFGPSVPLDDDLLGRERSSLGAAAAALSSADER